MVYDVSDPGSLKAIDTWREEAIKFCPENVSLILLGNKSDSTERKVTKEEGKEVANKYNMTFLETSAKTGTNVNESFHTLTKEIKNKVAFKTSDTSGRKKLTDSTNIPGEKKKGCC